MDHAPATEVSWSPRKILRISGVIFLIQAAVIWFISQRSNVTVTPEKGTRFRFVAARIKGDELFKFVAAPSADILAIPSNVGFSGAAWLKPKPANYEPPRWDEPVRWLAQNPSSLGQMILEQARNYELETPDLSTDTALERESAIEALPMVERKAGLHISGPLASRATNLETALPAWENGEPLNDSVVEIVANPAGDVVSARLAEPSGLGTADNKALQIARETRFKPINTGSGLTFGKITFQWRTLPPTTNQVSNGRVDALPVSNP